MQIIDTYADLDLDEHIFLNLSAEINLIIEPLVTYFGLDSFNYFKTYNDDSQIRLTNTPQWVKHYLTNRLYLQSIFELSARNYAKNRIIWSNVGTHNVILQECLKFGINHGVTLVEPTADGCEFYFLGTTMCDKNVINNYLSNFYLLEKFIDNFHTLGATLFKLIEPQRLIIRDRLQNDLKFDAANNINKFSFLASIYGYKFTNRELEYIPLLLRGLSAKQIGESLQISFRTVEEYINNIKDKTNTTSKNELISLLVEKFNY